MAITADRLKITIRGVFQGQRFENVQWYYTSGAAFLTATAEGVGEAYWNDIKAAWRASHVTSTQLTTESIFVSEPSDVGAFGEFSIPTAEKQGTRSPGTLGDFLPSFCATAVRLTVATRATKPGQKRFVGMLEGDVDTDLLKASYTALIATLAAKFSAAIILGAPVATGSLIPIIQSVDRATGALGLAQEVTGFVINPRVSSQVSRKFGRGV